MKNIVLSPRISFIVNLGLTLFALCVFVGGALWPHLLEWHKARVYEAALAAQVVKESEDLYYINGLSYSLNGFGAKSAVLSEAPYERYSYQEAAFIIKKATETRPAYINTFGRLNVRSEPEAEAEVIGAFSYREQITVTGRTEDGYYQVSGTDIDSGETVKGYCLAEMISEGEVPDAYVILDVPSFKQADEQWTNVALGDRETLGTAGCTTTCLAMLYSYLEDETIYPDEMAAQINYTTEGNLTFSKDFVHYNGSYLYEIIFEKLQAGMPVLFSRINPATTSHWVLVIGYVGDGVTFNEEDFIINDPGSASRFTLADFSRDYTVFNKIVYYDPK